MPKTKPAPARLTYEAVAGDCVEVLRTRPPGFADLVIADPPYNTAAAYDSYDDRKSYVAYLDWTYEWLTAARLALADHGSLWVFAPDEWVSEIDLHCRKGLGFTKRRHVVWAFTFGQRAANNFTRSHCHLLYMTRHPRRFTFNPEPLKVPSARQLVYNDRRAEKGGKLPDSTWMLLKEQLEPYMTPDVDTWLQSRVCGTYREREDYSPNQIPVAIMDRIVLACSNPGDLVVDPFAGTFSSGVSAACNGRSYLGVDVSKKCVRAGRLRMARELAA